MRGTRKIISEIWQFAFIKPPRNEFGVRENNLDEKHESFLPLKFRESQICRKEFQIKSTGLKRLDHFTNLKVPSHMEGQTCLGAPVRLSRFCAVCIVIVMRWPIPSFIAAALVGRVAILASDGLSLNLGHDCYFIRTLELQRVLLTIRQWDCLRP